MLTQGLILNTDAGFDYKDFRNWYSKKDIDTKVCSNKPNGEVDWDEYFDEELYDQRFAIGQTNA